MKTAISIILLITLFLSSCGLTGSKNPCKGIMDKEKFTEILTDIYLVEASLHKVHGSEEVVLDSVSIYYNALFKKHDTTKEEVEKAIECYVLEREIMTEIHDEIMYSLSVMESKLSDEDKK